MPKVVVIDCRTHMLGRLSATVAKELLQGQHVVLLRAEEANISGSLFRNKLKYQYYLNLRSNHNPRKGPFHFRAPARMIFKTIRGMIPHKTARGTAALERLKIYEGIPKDYVKTKRQVIPVCLRNHCLKPGRKYCRLGDLAHSVGWKHQELMVSMEQKRKTEAAAWYNTKKELNKLKGKVEAAPSKELAEVNEKLAVYGY